MPRSARWFHRFRIPSTWFIFVSFVRCRRHIVVWPLFFVCFEPGREAPWWFAGLRRDPTSLSHAITALQKERVGGLHERESLFDGPPARHLRELARLVLLVSPEIVGNPLLIARRQRMQR